MKRMKVFLMIGVLLAVFSGVSLAAPADLVGKVYSAALAVELGARYGLAEKVGSDNRHGFIYFPDGDFTLAVLVRNNVIVKVIAGRY